MGDAQEKQFKCKCKWKGAGFRISSPYSGLFIVYARAFLQPISNIPAILHENLHASILSIYFIMMIVMWLKSKVFFVSYYTLRNRLHQTWAIPRFGFQYFLPFAAKGINDQIEAAILRANKLGLKVISLAALNKNEAIVPGME